MAALIKQGKFIDETGQEQDVVFIGAEKAIFDDDGNRLDQKLKGSINTFLSLTEGDFHNLEKGNYVAVSGLANAPNSTDGFFVEVTATGNEKIVKATSLSSGQQFFDYYNGESWFGWFEPSTGFSVQFLATSLTTWAASLPNGKFGFSLGGDSYTGNDLPSGTYWKYGSGVVIKRLGNSGTLILCDNSGNISTRALAGGVWSDWDSVVMGSQIQSGGLAITNISGGVVTQRVTFDTPFSKAPIVTVTAESANPSHFSVSIGVPSTTGFDVYLYAPSTTAPAPRGVEWIAVST